MRNSFQNHAEGFEEFLSVVWMAALLTQTQGHWAALSVLLDFNRLKGTGDENNFLPVYLRDSYSNYGNLTRPNFHIISVSSLIWVFSFHYTICLHQLKYPIQTVWWMGRIKSKNYGSSRGSWKWSLAPCVFLYTSKHSEYSKSIQNTFNTALPLHTREERKTQDYFKFSPQTRQGLLINSQHQFKSSTL